MFGYDRGHSLLSGSRELEKDEKSRLLTYTDLIPDRPAQVDGYLSGIPLPSSGCYALMQTWTAPELPRPGCVWTHALVFDEEQLGNLNLNASPRNWFKRPSIVGDFSEYRKTAQYDPMLQPLLDSDEFDITVQLVRATYAAHATRHFPSSPEAEHLLFRLWMNQWLELREQFSFRTAGKANTHSKTEQEFSLRLVNDVLSEQTPSTQLPWENTVASDILADGSTGFSKFARAAGAHIGLDQNTIRFLAQLYVRLKNASKEHDQWPDLLSLVNKAVPGAAGDKLRNIFFDGQAMAYFELKPLKADQVLNISIDDFNSGVVNVPWWTNVDWKLESIEALEQRKKDNLIEKFIGTENQLPNDLISVFIDYIKHHILVFDLSTLTDTTIAEIRKNVVDTVGIKSLDLSNSTVLINLINMVSATTYLLPDLVQELADKRDLDSLSELGERLPVKVASVILDHVGRLGKSDASLDFATSVLQKLPSSIIYNQIHEQEYDATQLYIAIKSTGYDVSAGLHYSSSEWTAVLLRTNVENLNSAKWLQVQTYFLAIALSRPEPGCEPIFESCFVDVHDAWATGQIDKKSKSLLMSVMPRWSVWTWDWCWALTKDVARAYAVGKLDRERLHLLHGDNVSTSALK